MAAKKHGFTSAAHRRAVFAENPTLGHNIAKKYGAKVGGGYTKNQIAARRSAAGKGQTYKP
jgi:hypothetical protein